MGIDVLGALRVGGLTPSLQRRDQVVLCALALHPGDVLSADRLADALWGDEPPRSWSKVVQGCVLRIRRALGPSSIETTTAGYRLALADDEIDSRRFEEFVDRGVALVATGEFDRAIVVFSRALDLWRGPPFEVLDSWLPGRIEAARLDELRRSTEERLLDARLAAGEHRDVVAIAEVRVAEEPLREHRWATLALAQYRCGRQADALRSLRRARQTLVEELGIEPGTEIVALERAILEQDDDLLATPEPPAIAEHCPYKGSGTLRRRRRRGLLRADRRRGRVRRATADQPVAGRHRSVGLRQVVDRPGRSGAGTGAGRPVGRRVRARARCGGGDGPGAGVV